MSELVNYSTGVTVPSSWLNSVQLREEGKASYVVYKAGSTFYAKSQLPGGTDYSDPLALKTIQNAINTTATNGGGTIFIREGNYIGTGLAGNQGLTIIDQNNITIKGVRNKTVIGTATAAGVALNVGNANATDGSYHAQNILLEDLVFDGGYSGVSNGAGLGIQTAFNVQVNRCVFQNAGEIATGGFRVATWNGTASRNKNIWISNCYFNQQKISLLGITNGWLTDCIFDGLAPGASGAKALVDFASFDFSPVTQEMLIDVHFSRNKVYGWTLTGFLGFQGIQGCSIDNNYFDGLANLLSTTNSATTSLNGLSIENNQFWNCTGGITIGYGDRIRIIGNKLMTDSTPGGQSTGISVSKQSLATEPTNVQIEDNTIYKWGGVGIGASFIRGSISRNLLVDENQANGNGNSLAGILILDNLMTNVNIENNEIYSTPASGAGSSRPINYNGVATNLTITGNIVNYTAVPTIGIFFGATVDPSVIIRNNTGYNPQAATNVTAGATPWTYTNNDAYDETMVLNNLNGGTVSAISYKGDAGYPTTVNGFPFFLQPGQTITVTWATTAPTFRKYPQ